MNRTAFPNEKSASRRWLLVDAAGQTLGRLASRIAIVLRGKHKAAWSPHTDIGDYVVVVNAAAVAVTGAKERAKRYFRHTQYPGGIRSQTLAEMRSKHPDRIITHAVRGMLPKGPLGSRMLTKLHVYAGAEHKHESQVPERYDPAVRAR